MENCTNLDVFTFDPEFNCRAFHFGALQNTNGHISGLNPTGTIFNPGHLAGNAATTKLPDAGETVDETRRSIIPPTATRHLPTGQGLRSFAACVPTSCDVGYHFGVRFGDFNIQDEVKLKGFIC